MRTRSRSKLANTQSFNQILDDRKSLVVPELQEVVQLEDSSFPCSLYHDLASDSTIDSFLKKSRFYSLASRRWKIPRNYTKLLDSNSLAPVSNIVSSIVKWFWADATAQGHRQVMDTHATDLRHCQHDPPSHNSRPSFVIKAEGPSFQLPSMAPGENQAQVGFANIAGCIEIQVEGDALPVDEQLARVAIYARQLFIHQPNRRFVRVLFLTGHLLRLFHFDSSGAQYTPPLDIHQDPHTFVRLVLGMSSPNEADIGFDTSVRWSIENGRKVAGTLTSRGTGDVEMVYPLLDIEPFFSRPVIRGRCTRCWRVSDPVTGEELLVKDSWKSDDKTSEHVFLQMASGIPGIVQMVSCEPNRGQTKDLRSFEAELPANFQNRVESRVIIKLYGQPISKFSSTRELLCSLRDAIEGHRQLLKKGALHRDISIQNILKGKPSAKPGHRAILIDLDMALRYTADSIEPTDWRIGTYLYQSVMVLRSCELDEPLVHDHLDDLESFLYVLSYIIHVYDSQGVFHSIPTPFRQWSDHGDDHGLLSKLKEGFLVQQSIPMQFSSRWPSPCLEVFHSFRRFIKTLVHKKIDISIENPADGQDILRSLRYCAEDHYSYVLGLFDKGIAALEKDQALASPTQPPPASTQASQGPIVRRSPLKRSSDDYPDAQPAAKRLNSPRILRNPRGPHSPISGTPYRSA